MKVIYDKETDTLSIILREAEVAESDELREGFIIDFDKDGKVVSMEILDASDYIAEPSAITYEPKPVKTKG